MKKSFVNFFVAAAVLGTFTISIPANVYAKRIHDPQIETKSEQHQLSKKDKTRNVSRKERRKSLNSRIEEMQIPLEEPTPVVIPQIQVPQTISAADSSIIGTPMASQKQCVKYLLSNNPNPSLSVSAEEIVAYYYEEGKREGIRPDVAFAQALKETGFFRYGGTVTPDQNNYCGLGTTSATVKGEYFPNPQIGVRAHIQHLLAYSSTRKPVMPVVDPRYSIVRNAYGSRVLGEWSDLNGRWAVPGNSYGQEILSMFRAILFTGA